MEIGVLVEAALVATEMVLAVIEASVETGAALAGIEARVEALVEIGETLVEIDLDQDLRNHNGAQLKK